MLKAAFFLLFNRKRFIELAKQRSDEMLHEQQDRDKARQAGERGEPPYYEAQTTTVRRAVGYSLVLVLLVIFLGWVTGHALNRIVGPPSQATARLILYSGIGTLLWATLGKCGWSIQSFKGTTLPEQVDDFLFRVLYLVGSFLLVLSGTWSASYWS